MPKDSEAAGLAHGASHLPGVDVLSYNVEIRDDEGLVGDRASKGAFRHFIESWRKPLRKIGEDPFGDIPSDKLAKKKLDELLAKGEPETAGVIQSAIESLLGPHLNRQENHPAPNDLCTLLEKACSAGISGTLGLRLVQP